MRATNKKMSKKSDSFHETPFDDGTLTKLKLFSLYVNEWFSTCAANTKISRVCIYDFFAGTGQDSTGEPGSPILTCDIISKFLKDAYSKAKSALNEKLSIRVYCFDSEEYKVDLLRQLVATKGYARFSIEIECLDFAKAFYKCKGSISSPQEASLLILDQFGVKNVGDAVFKEITTFPFTDFLMFFSSSYMKRFGGLDITKTYFNLSDSVISELQNEDPHAIHKAVVEKIFKPLAPKNYFLAPFSICKNTNVYGIIFGSRHLLGLQKFLDSAWTVDNIHGEANRNLTNDIYGDRDSLFYTQDKPVKIKNFERSLIDFLQKDKVTNYDVLVFGLTSGFSIKKIQEALLSINNVHKINIIPQNDYNPRSTTFGIVKTTYKGNDIVFLKIENETDENRVD